ncbi:MAG TPA: Ig-like domain-containing protein [Humibacter sp.]|nr:Ig-like domain-containing protein [Humibacter sp.]
MLSALSSWVRGHKTVASAVAIALVAGVPVTFAVLHDGFPVSDVNLDSRDVWVTNGDTLMGGRLNHQIGELDASVVGSSADIDVLQDGGAYFLADVKHGTLDRIDQAYSSLVDRVSIPTGAQLSYGGNTLAVLSPQGSLWVLDASGRLDFDPLRTHPVAKLGSGAHVVVTKSGKTFATSAQKNALISVDGPASVAHSTPLEVPRSIQLSAVGDQPVMLDRASDRIIEADGSTVALPKKGLQLQQPGPANGYVLVASGSGLLKVPLGGGATDQVAAGIRTPLSDSSQVSAPVWLNGCAYGAWAGAQRYLYSCDGKPAIGLDIDQSVQGDDLKFRVNHDVIALNDLQNGNSWVVSSHMQLVQNWAMLKPNQTTKQGDKGEEKPVLQSFADMLAQRTKVNRPPVAVNDSFGVRAGRSTVLPVLENDTDPDGDVLTITKTTPIPTTQGTLDLINGGRAIQFTPSKKVVGTISFRYSVDDGRGGTATAQVDASIHPDDVNKAPKSIHLSTAQVEVGQSVSYNVLNDWLDPDGDDLSLVAAAATTDDSVQFTPDGLVTFTSKNGQSGSKEVRVTISDGHLSTTGTLIVTVKAQGSLNPIATPDYATGFTGTPVTVHPLDNDVSPSGDPLQLVGAELDSGPAGRVTVDADRQTVTLDSNSAGEFYIKYTLGSGAKTTIGLIRVNLVTNGIEAPPVAVTDTAYLRPGESTTVDVLQNDVSPSGRVLAVQSVSGSDDAPDLKIEVRDNAVVKLTAPGVLDKQVQLRYVVSDGVHTATAGITVVPIPPLVNHQPPIAVDDAATVRVGDIVTVPVLDNDYSPDHEPFSLDPALHNTSSAGAGSTAFISGSSVRYQAPKRAGQYSVVYGVTDKFGQKAQAAVTFNVTAAAKGDDRAPTPQPITIRAFAGSTIPVDVPLSGIDPDGDSVTLNGIARQPTLGRISKSTSTSFDYEAYETSGGTDTFTYSVTDTYGKSAIGTVRVGVIPRPAQIAPPIAVNDTVQVKPGKTAAVPVLANDSDPNGYTIALSKKLTQVDAALTASVHGPIVLVRAPKKQGAYVLRYSITNGQGGQASAYVQVVVTDKAKLQYPSALDHFIEPDQVARKTTVRVDVRGGAVNPSGLVGDLKVSVEGANAQVATVGSGGTVTVRPTKSRMAVTYRLTDPVTGLSGSAFIIIPPRGDATAPPHIKASLPQQIVAMNASKSWRLADVIDVPSGRPAKIVNARGLRATGGITGDAGDQSLRFSAQKGYRGPGSVTFEVNDGHEAGQSKDRVTQLVLPITVGNPDRSDVAPTFTPPTVSIQPGETATAVDLRASSYHPNPAILRALTYSGLGGATADVHATLSGSTLRISSPLGVQPGAIAKLTFTVSSGTKKIAGSVNVHVVSSQRPIATQKNPPQTSEVQRGNTVTLPNAASDDYWINPFPGSPLTITDATAVSAPAGVTVTHSSSSISVSVGSGAAVGSVNITYHVQDATKDPKRTAAAIGQYRVTIHDVPERPDTPAAKANGDSSMIVSINRAPADNGKPIDSYRIYANGSIVGTVNGLGDHTINGLSNGQAYTFTVDAHNADGWSVQSAASNSVTTYGKPVAPAAPTLSGSGYSPNGNLSWGWNGADTRGGLRTYQWKLSNGTTGQTTGTSASTGGASKSGNTWTVQVRQQNNGGVWSDWSAPSNGVNFADQPPPQPAAQTGPDNAHPVPCEVGGGTCHYFLIKGQHFTPNAALSVTVHCTAGLDEAVPGVTSDGNGDVDTSTYYTSRKPNCGTRESGSIVIDGVSSPLVPFG